MNVSVVLIFYLIVWVGCIVTGVWALDLIVDYTLDNTLIVILNTLLQHYHKPRISKHQAFPSMIRVIESNGFPLYECKAENIAFSTSIAEYYISVQADMGMFSRLCVANQCYRLM